MIFIAFTTTNTHRVKNDCLDLLIDSTPITESPSQRWLGIFVDKHLKYKKAKSIFHIETLAEIERVHAEIERVHAEIERVHAEIERVQSEIESMPRYKGCKQR